MTRICVCPFGLRGPRRIPHALPNCVSANSCYGQLQGTRRCRMGSRGSSCKRTVKPHNSSTPLHAVPKTRAAVQHGAAETQVQDQASHRNKLAVSSTSRRPRARHPATRLRSDSARHGQVEGEGRAIRRNMRHCRASSSSLQQEIAGREALDPPSRSTFSALEQLATGGSIVLIPRALI